MNNKLLSYQELEEELLKGPDKDVLNNLDSMIRSRNSLIQIVTSEEGRVVHRLRQLAQLRGKKIIFWTCTDGIFQYNNENKRVPYQMTVDGKPWGAEGRSVYDPLTFLDFIGVDDDIPQSKIIKDSKQFISLGGGANYVLLDLPNFMPSTQGSSQMSEGEIRLVRKLKDLKELFNVFNYRKNIIIISRDVLVPNDLKTIMPIVDWPLPNKDSIIKHLYPLARDIENAYAQSNIDKKFDNEEISILADSLLGLTLDEITNTFRQSAVRNPDKISTDSFVKYNIQAKKDIIRKSRSGLEFYETKFSIKDSVGGLSELKNWIAKRANAYSEDAQKYGLEYPKGVLLVGIPGNGKSLIAKSIANEWNKLLLKWDVGSVYSGIVGSSEANVRNVIKTAETVSPCILFIDEVEKAFSGIGSSDKSDGGTAARVFGTFIQWLSDKETPVFVVATANRIDQLPPEFTRKGRFDAIFFVDIPDKKDRLEIIQIHLNKRNIKLSDENIMTIADATEYFTGAEIESVIKDSMYSAFTDNKRQVNINDILYEIDHVIPLALTSGSQINELREWANQNAIPASRKIDSKIETKKQLKEKQDYGLEIISYQSSEEGDL